MICFWYYYQSLYAGFVFCFKLFGDIYFYIKRNIFSFLLLKYWCCILTQQDESRRVASTLFPTLSPMLKRKKDHGSLTFSHLFKWKFIFCMLWLSEWNLGQTLGSSIMWRFRVLYYCAFWKAWYSFTCTRFLNVSEQYQKEKITHLQLIWASAINSLRKNNFDTDSSTWHECIYITVNNPFLEFHKRCLLLLKNVIVPPYISMFFASLENPTKNYLEVTPLMYLT